MVPCGCENHSCTISERPCAAPCKGAVPLQHQLLQGLQGPGYSPMCLSLPGEDSRHCLCAGSCLGRQCPPRAAALVAPRTLHCSLQSSLRANGCHGVAPPRLPDLLLRGALRRERNLQCIFFGQEWAQTSSITIAAQYYAFAPCLFLLTKCSWHWPEAHELGS